MYQLKDWPIHDLGVKFQDEPTKKVAWKIVKEYFEFFEEEGLDEMIWFMLVQTMKSDSEDVTGKDRSNVLFFYEYTKILNKAVFYLSKLKQEKLNK